MICIWLYERMMAGDKNDDYGTIKVTYSGIAW